MKCLPLTLKTPLTQIFSKLAYERYFGTSGMDADVKALETVAPTASRWCVVIPEQFPATDQE